jgi:hypothetical protein
MKEIILCMWAFATSLSFPYRVFRIVFALSYPSEERADHQQMHELWQEAAL